MRSDSPGHAVAERRHQRGAHPLDAVRARDDLPGADRDAAARALADPLRRRLRPRIDDRTHLDTGVGEVDRCGVGAVVGGEHDGRAPGQHAVAVQEGAGAAGEHDAGTVVVGEHDRALVRPGRHEHAAGADAPDPLPRQVRAVRRRRGGRCAAPVPGRSRRRSARTRWSAAGAARRGSPPARRWPAGPSPAPARRRCGRRCPGASRPPRTARRPARRARPPGRPSARR